MVFHVAREGLDEARGETLTLLQETRNVPVCERRYDWLYRRNPDGEAALWTIRKVETGELAGFTVALPRRMLTDGRVTTCWNGADFSIRRKFRTLGVAMKLRRAAKEGVDAGEAEFLYAHPNAKMQLIHEKVGHSPVGEMVRYALPLRYAPYFKRRLPGRWLPTMAGAALDTVGACRRCWRPHCWKSDVQVEETPMFDDRFDQLFADAQPARRIVGVRDSTYLTWRYGDNPAYRTHAVLARRAGHLVGYALFTCAEEVTHVKDIFTGPEEGVAEDLIVALVRHARRGKKSTSVSAIVLEGNPLEETFIHAGFTRREDTSQMFGYARREGPLGETLSDRNNWLVTVGDRDV